MSCSELDKRMKSSWRLISFLDESLQEWREDKQTAEINQRYQQNLPPNSVCWCFDLLTDFTTTETCSCASSTTATVRKRRREPIKRCFLYCWLVSGKISTPTLWYSLRNMNVFSCKCSKMIQNLRFGGFVWWLKTSAQTNTKQLPRVVFGRAAAGLSGCGCNISQRIFRHFKRAAERVFLPEVCRRIQPKQQ